MDLELRKTYFGGTDIAAFLGRSKWRTPMDVAVSKWGLAPEQADTPPEETPDHLLAGKIFEQGVAEFYEIRTGNGPCTRVTDFQEQEFILHPDYPWAAGSPDRLVFRDGKLHHGVEIKTQSMPMRRYWGEPGTDEIPDDYLLQVHWYLFVASAFFKTDIPYWDAPVVFGGYQFECFRGDRDKEFEQVIFGAARDFWERVVIGGEVPEIDGSKSSAKYLSYRHRVSTDEMLQADEKADDYANALRISRSRVDAWTLEKHRYENKLKEIIGDARGIAGDEWRVTWSGTTERRFRFTDYAKAVNE